MEILKDISPLLIALASLVGGVWFFRQWITRTNKKVDGYQNGTEERDKKVADNYQKLNDKIQTETEKLKDKIEQRFNEQRSTIDDIKNKVIQIDINQVKLELMTPKINDIQTQVTSQTSNILLIQEEASRNANSIHKIWNHIQTIETQQVNGRKPKAPFNHDIIRDALKSEHLDVKEKEKIIKLIEYAREYEPWNVEKFVHRVNEKIKRKKNNKKVNEVENEFEDEFKVHLSDQQPKNPDSFKLEEVDEKFRVSSTLLDKNKKK